jgi:tungstate transport system ATP-binding protein
MVTGSGGHDRMSTAALIHFYHVRKDIAGRRLLDIAELAIFTGRCLLLTGDNGAGKTTLLKILAGLERPDRAEVAYKGEVLPWALARGRYQDDIVYLHQTPYLFDRSVTQNVSYGLRRAGMPRAQVATRVADTLAWAGLSHLAERNARVLSGGERQRVALARARVLSPSVLLLDEPVASMDQESRERTYFLIERLKGEGMGVVVTSHELHGIAALADLHLNLHDAELHAQPPVRRKGEGRALGRNDASRLYTLPEPNAK